jgi:tRNA nucleotidyltransferase (CCA-adding enzyme)
MSLIDYTAILENITPSTDESLEISQATQTVISSLLSSAKKNDVDVDIVSGGSTAKGTFLKGNHDIDIFVRFKLTNTNISNSLELFLDDFSKQEDVTVERIHGSRDYFNFIYNNFHFEIIPVKYITSSQEAENVTDMSPLHSLWVQKHLTASLRKDILLAKQFCKSQGVYGAESYINGISGHVLDILLIYYGSFDAFIDAVSRWEEPVIIDPENKHTDVFISMNEAKLKSPLVVVDPIDPMRNASAALSVEKFNQLIFCANEFLAQASQDFFVIKPFSLSDISSSKKSNELFVAVQITPLEGNRDIVGTKILKLFEYVQRELQDYGFILYRCGWNFDYPSHLYFFLDEKPLEKTYIRKGPPIHSSEGVNKFKEKHGSAVFEKDDFLYVTLQREFVDVYHFLSWILAQEFCMSRATSIHLLS